MSDKHYKGTQPTLGFQRVLQRAIFKYKPNTEVNGANVLCGFLVNKTLKQYIFSTKKALADWISCFINHGPAPMDNNPSMPQFGQPDEVVIDHPHGENVLDKYTTNLSKRVQEGKIDPIIGGIMK